MPHDALIGHSGFVGSTLLKQASFGSRYRSTDIDGIRGGVFDRVVCAGAPAQKWIANGDPAADRARIEGLIGHLSTVACGTFILISTVDVFGHPVDVDEASPVEEEGLCAYGLHRRRLETFVQERFPRHLVVRLPGLVGPGLRKNIVFDLLHDHQVHAIDSGAVFQFYPMVNLWSDIAVALAAGLSLVHLTAEPIGTAAVAAEGFGRTLEQAPSARPARYDMRTRHAALFGTTGAYQYRRRETLTAIRAYAQSEARSR